MSEHYFTKRPTSKKLFEDIEFTFKHIPFKFQTVSGTFSIRRLDKGTEIMLKYADILDGSKILDLGCGWGPVAIIVKKLYPNCKVHATDINIRAVNQTEINVKKNRTTIEVYQSDGFEKITDHFDIILLNPPQTAGKDVCFKLIELSKNFLNKKGSLQIVARTKKGGKSLSEKMENVFGNIEIIGRGSGFRVYKSNV